jgi:cytochrome c oxidase assembly protein subunit 15
LITLVAVFALQVTVGGITIHESNSPRSVLLHWAVAMLLLATLIVLALLAYLAPRPGSGVPSVRPGTPVPALVVAAFFAYVTMCIGSYVSSSNAGLACSTFPTCVGTFLGTSLPQLVQMMHRLAAATFLVTAVVAAVVAAQSGMTRVRAWAFGGLALALLQIVLGIANVVFSMPVPLREAHAGNAALTFLAFVVATFLATVDPLAERPSITKGLSVRRAV